MNNLQHNPFNDSEAEQDDMILQAFHEAGLRMTDQRRALLDVIRTQSSFMDAETLHQLANLQGVSLSLATVYRTLTLFKEMELIEVRVNTTQDREEYRFRFQNETYTLICKRCSAIVPVESEKVDAFCEEVMTQLGVVVLTTHLCFVGYCATCTIAMLPE